MTSVLDRVFGDEQPLTLECPIYPERADDVDVDPWDGVDLGDYQSDGDPPVAMLRQAVIIPPNAKPGGADSGTFGAPASAKPIPFDRVLSYHRFHQMNGRDVLAVQRALSFARLRFRPATWSYGWLMRDEIELLQRRHGLPVTGVYGPKEHAWLSPWFDGYARWLYTHDVVTPPRPTRTAGERLTRAAWYLYAQRPWAYHAVRPFILFGYGDRIAYQYDCSWMATEAAYLAKISDPNGFGYHGGYGNTTTLLEHGTRVTGVVLAGDFHHYGEWGSLSDPAHVTVEVGNFRCIGHGGPGGPRLLPSNYRPIVETRRHT